MGNIFLCIWEWLQCQWIQSDLASWLAVVLAVMAIIYALRKAQHTELYLKDYQFHFKDGLIETIIEMYTYSHSSTYNAKAKAKVDGMSCKMDVVKPVKIPANYQINVINVLEFKFIGKFIPLKKIPKTVKIDVKIKLSDGSSAKLHKYIDIVVKKSSTEPILDKEDSQPE